VLVVRRLLALAVVAAAIPTALAAASPRAFSGAVVFSTEPGATQLSSVARDGSGLRQLTSVFGGTLQVVLSPDRSLVAVETSVGGLTTQLAVGSVEDGSYRIVAHANLMTALSWSADSRWLSYVDFMQTPTGESVGSLRIVRADGSGQRRLADLADIESEWAPTGETLAFSDGARLRLYDAETGSTRVVASYPDTGVASPRWSPDGRRLAFLRNDRADLMVYDLLTGAVRVVASDPLDPPRLHYGIGGFDWSPNSRYLAFTTNRFYEFGLHVIDVIAGSARVTAFTGSCYGLAWSPDGSRLAVLSRGLGPTPGLLNLAVIGSDLNDPTATTYDVSAVLWSSDSRELVYGTGEGSVMAVSADGSTTRTVVPPLTEIGGPPVPLGWSRDGGRLFLSGSYIAIQPNSQLYRVDAGTHLIRPLTVGDGDHEQPAVSADGSHIAYVLDRDAERTVVVSSADGSGPVEIGTGAQPTLSPDGSRIAFVRKARIRVTSAKPGRKSRVLLRGTWPAWSPDGRLIAFLRSGAVWVADADGSRKHRVAPAGFDSAWGPPSWFGGSGALYLPQGDGPGGKVVRVDGSVAQDIPLPASSTAVSVPSQDGQTIAFEPATAAGSHQITTAEVGGTASETLAETLDLVRERGQLRRRLAWLPAP
jgi:Tol biopolymer transport system component